jgi:hypothetical protein
MDETFIDLPTGERCPMLAGNAIKFFTFKRYGAGCE